MHSKKYSRSGVFTWSPSGIDCKGLIVGDFAQHFDPTSTDTQSRLEYLSLADLHAGNTASPSVKVNCQYRFNELSWTKHTSSVHPLGIICGGTDDGTVVFFDADKFVNHASLSVISSRKDHQGHVMSIDCSLVDDRWAMSGGGAGQLLLWDLTNLASPFSPGTPNSHDQVKMVRWNRVVEQIAGSISSHRCSIWDMRRPGAPILEFGELGGGCDWSSLCWSPSDASTLLLASQSDVQPLMQKWDLRYLTAPVKEYPAHRKGITAMNWHSSDARLVLSASTDGQICMTNPDSGETVGRVGCEQGDWVRNVAWSGAQPDLLAVQYFQHPIQISSIQSISGAEPSSLPVELSLVPAWVSAAPVGASFALGGRMATHSKHWDEATQKWNYSVDIRQVPVDPELKQSATGLLDACDTRKLSYFCEDRAVSSQDVTVQTIWAFLDSRANQRGFNDYIRILGFGNDSTTATDSSTTTTTNTVSKMSTSSREVSQLTDRMGNLPMASNQNGRVASAASDSSSDEVFDLAVPITWTLSENDELGVMDLLIVGNEEAAVSKLLEQKDFPSAFLLAREHPNLLRMVSERYMRANITNSARLMAAIVTDSLDLLIDSIPADQWQRVLALALSRLRGSRLTKVMQRIADKFVDQAAPLRAVLPYIVSGDVDAMLMVNVELPLSTRVEQAVILRQALSGGDDRQLATGDAYEEVLVEYCERLISGGLPDLAWRLIKNVESTNLKVSTLRYALFEACGPGIGVGTKRPFDPYQTEKQAYSTALRPGARPAAPVYGNQNANAYSTPGSYQQPSSYPQPGPVGSYPQPRGGYAPPNAMAPPPAMGTPYGQPTAAPPMMAPPPIGGPSYNQQPAASYHGGPPPSAAGMGMPGYPNPSQQYQQPMAPAPPMMTNSYAPVAPPPVGPPPTIAGNPGMSTYGQQPQPMRAPSVASSVGAWAPAPLMQPSPPAVPSPAPVSPQKPCTPGWNDPPALAAKCQTPKPTANVMEVHWKPLDQPSAGMPHGMPGGGMGAPVMPPSMSSSSTAPAAAPAAPPPVVLSAEDQPIIDRLLHLCDAILSVNRQPVAVRKAEDARARIQSELATRLSAGRLSLPTRQLLWHLSDQASKGEFAAALMSCGQLVRTGGDFVEVSSFLPALKSLISTAQSSFKR